MIPVARVPEPTSLDSGVRVPGNKWLAGHPGAKRPKPFWAPCLGPLADGFTNLCGYAAMLDPTGGTVDHYLSYRNRPDLAYEWIGDYDAEAFDVEAVNRLWAGWRKRKRT